MTQYSEIPYLNALYMEQQQLRSAIALIDAGGVLSSFVISPPPPPPYDPANPPAPPMQMPSMAGISNVGTVLPETMAAIKVQLEERDAEITAQLGTSGVVF